MSPLNFVYINCSRTNSSFKIISYVSRRVIRKHFCKLRISAHKLAIETGRYTVPKTLPDDRYCLLCKHGSVESEYHFLSQCVKLSDVCMIVTFPSWEIMFLI